MRVGIAENVFRVSGQRSRSQWGQMPVRPWLVYLRMEEVTSCV